MTDIERLITNITLEMKEKSNETLTAWLDKERAQMHMKISAEYKHLRNDLEKKYAVVIDQLHEANRQLNKTSFELRRIKEFLIETNQTTALDMFNIQKDREDDDER